MSKIRKEEEELKAPVMPGEINRDAVTAAGKNLSMAKGVLNNMSYDTFKQGSIYDGLKKSYEQQGKTAMKDVLGQVAARTGGMASSYATSAANQSYNNYMKGLEDAARAMYNEEYAKNRDKVDLAQREYDTAYGMYRDDTADAWTRYNAENDAYWKNKNYNYQLGRDTIEDERYEETQNANNRQDYLDSIIEMAAAGIAPVWDEAKAAEFGITKADFDNAVGIGTNQYKNSAGYLSNQAATDETIRSMLTSESFDWDTYDWNGDAEGLGSAADYFAGKGSAYDSGYWQGIYNDAQQGYADENTKAAQEEVIAILEAGGEPPIDLLIDAGWLEEIAPVNEGETPNYDTDNNGIPDGLSGLAATMWQNNIDSKTEADTKEAQENAVDDIEARIDNGESLEEIAKDYNIKTGGKTWEEVTGMSAAEWQQRFNENYDYANTNAGRAEIIDTFVDSASFSLSERDQKNFDHLFGNGAYEKVQTYIKDLAEIDPRTMTADAFSDAMASLEASLPTRMTTEQIDEFIKKANPEAWKAVSDKTYFDPKKPLNGGIMK